MNREYSFTLLLVLLVAAACTTVPQEGPAASNAHAVAPVAGSEDSQERGPTPLVLPDGLTPVDSPLLPTEGSPMAGIEGAAVTAVVHFTASDLFNGHTWGVIKELREQWGLQARVVVKPVLTRSFQADSSEVLLLRALLAAHRQDAFWRFSDRVAAEPEARGNFGVSSNAEEAEELILGWAEEAELDLERFQVDRADPTIDEVILRSSQEVRNRGPVIGLTLTINGEALDLSSAHMTLSHFEQEPGTRDNASAVSRSMDNLQPALNEALAAATAHLETTSSPERIYLELVEQNVLSISRLGERIQAASVSLLTEAPIDIAAGADASALVTIIEICHPDTGDCNSELTTRLLELYPDEIRVLFWPRPLSSTPFPERTLLQRAAFLASASERYADMRAAFDELLVPGADLPDPDTLAEIIGVDAELLSESDPPGFSQWQMNTQSINQTTNLVAFVDAFSMPTLVINGVLVPGQYNVHGHTFSAQAPLSGVIELVERQLELARHVMARTGKEGRELYELLVELNAEEPPDAVPFQRDFTVDQDSLDLSGLPSRGPDGGLPIVLFHDFANPLSAASYQALLVALEDHPREARITWHPVSDRGARWRSLIGLAMEEQDLFWEVHDSLLSYGPFFELDGYLSWLASTLEFDEGALRDRIEEESLGQEFLRRDEARSRAGVLAPSILIGDELVVGNPGVDGFREVLERAP